MSGFQAGDVVWLPFPFVEAATFKSRPALVVAANVGVAGNLIWVFMITSTERTAWPGDVLIDDHQAVGLPVPSTIRTAKITALEAASARCIGRIDTVTLATVRSLLARYLDFQ